MAEVNDPEGDMPGPGDSTQPRRRQVLRVFISYSRDDLDFAQQLIAALEIAGFDISIDLQGITGGEDFQRRLGVLIREADTIVFVLSPSSATSEMCTWEVDEAVRLGKRIIPVLCRPLEGNDPPSRLKNLDYVFFYAEPKVAGSGFGRGLARLVASLNTDLDWMREHTRLLARATEWDTAGRVQNRMLSGADIAQAKSWASKRPRGAPEPTALHLDYIRASEEAENERLSSERKRIEEMTHAQAGREEALRKAEVAQAEKAIVLRRLAQRTTIALVAAGLLTLAAATAGYFAWSNQRAAEVERQRAERNLDAITAAAAVIDNQSDPRQVAQTFFSLAHTQLDQNRLDEAVTLYKRSLAIAEKQLGSDSSEVAAIRSQLGIVLAKVSNYADAEPLLKQGLAYYERTNATDHPNVATILAVLTDIYGAQGRQAELTDITAKSRLLVLANTADIVPVFFGTDRAAASNANRLVYGSDRGRQLQLGRALVTVPKIHELSNIERPWSVRIPYFDLDIYKQAEDPRQHFTIVELSRMVEPELATVIKERAGRANRYKDQAFVFVHGYHSSFDYAVFRTAQLAYTFGFDGPAFVYSWPSADQVPSYTFDRESAEQSEPYLRDFLRFVTEKSGAKRISVIAQSLGSIPVLNLLRDFHNATPTGVAIDQLILVAPDMDRDSFTAVVQAVRGVAKGITLYAASNDRALLLSRNFFGGVPRAGDVPAEGPVQLPGIDTIDITAADAVNANTQMNVSANYLLSDIKALLETGVRPPDKRSAHLVAKNTPAGVYWVYQP